MFKIPTGNPVDLGNRICTTYQKFGAAGIITSGMGRDLDQVRAIKFSAFTKGTICSHGYSHIPSVQVPVHVGGITIFPGDLLHSDQKLTINSQSNDKTTSTCSHLYFRILAHLRSI